MDEFKNTGVLIEPRRETDFVAGGETGIVYKVLEPTGNWQMYLSREERQSSRIFDTLACVTFSAVNAIECILNRMLLKREFSQEVLAFFIENGFIINGKFELSDRYIAKLSGTTRNGNYGQKVADTIRHFGFIPESMWAFDEAFDWDAYYADIPQNLIDLGKKVASFIDIQYEWVPANLFEIEHSLKQSPLQIFTPVCPGWSQSYPVKSCGLNVAHATMIYSVDETVNIFDHYPPFLKRLTLDYPIPYVCKYVVSEKKEIEQKPQEFRYKFEKIMKIGERSQDIAALQAVLIKDGVFQKNVLPTGYYGIITQKAVLAFQRKYKVASENELKALNGTRVGLKTLAKLNELYS